MSSQVFDVSVTTRYIDDQSAPDRGSYVFTYSVTIKNTGQVGAQLIARHWIITDANNHIEEIRGLGVVGRQPLLKPGENSSIPAEQHSRLPRGPCRVSFYVLPKKESSFGSPYRNLYFPCRGRYIKASFRRPYCVCRQRMAYDSGKRASGLKGAIRSTDKHR